MTDTITLTDSIVKTVVPEDRTDIVLREASGFALRVRGGSQSFYFMHTRPGMKGTPKSSSASILRSRCRAASRGRRW